VLRHFILEISFQQMNHSSPGRRALYIVMAYAPLAVMFGLEACSKAAPKPQRTPVAVTVVPVRRRSVPYDIDANGIVTPMQTANVSPQVDGIITEVNFSEGQDVVKGQVLFHLDPRPYKAAYDQAVAALTRDKASLVYALSEQERYGSLASQGIVTKEQAEQMRATAAAAAGTVQADSANVDNAKFNLENTTVRAPITGRTGGLLVRTGNLVHAAGGTPLVLINQVRPILVRFAVPASELPMILKYGEKNGNVVALPVTSIPGGTPAVATAADTTNPMDAASSSSAPAKRVKLAPVDSNTDGKGGLSFIDNQVDTTTGTVTLKAKYTNKNGTLWSGQFVSSSLRLYIEDSVLVLPTQAIVTGQQGTYVYVIDTSNTAQQRQVVVERAAGSISVITSGVAEGERVVTDGQSRVTPGSQVTVGLREPGSGGGAGGGQGRGGRGGGRGGRGGKGRGKADTTAAKPAKPE
jgi:membrane fusion protein, multidrug efflux system